MTWTSVGDAADVLEGDQAAEDGRPMLFRREDQWRLGGGEVIAAEIQLVGHVALARIDVFAVQVAVSLRAHRVSRGCAGFHLFLKSVTSPAMPGIEFMLQTAPLHQGVSSIRATSRPVGVVVAAGEEGLGLGVALLGQSPGLGQRPPPAFAASPLGIGIHHVIGSV